MAAKPKPVRGCKVRLNHDITTRGNRKFRAGVVMTLGGTAGEFGLHVTVRAKRYHLTLKKKDYPRAFTVIWCPPETELLTEVTDESDAAQKGS